MRRRVLWFNNYSVSLAREEWAQGRYPISHLWGTEHLRRSGMEVTGVEGSRLVRRLSRSAEPNLGDVAAQLAVAARGRGTGVAYAPYTHGLLGLARLRRCGVWRGRTVAVVHPAVPHDEGFRAAAAGIDLVVGISERSYCELLALPGRDERNTLLLPWGPDLDFPTTATDEGYVVSSGKTWRDADTLLAAVERVGIPARVFVGDDRPLPAGVTPIRRSSYAKAMWHTSAAAVVCIPLTANEAGYGMTEFNDALALAKPIVMTRNAHFVDIEAHGFGIWVEPGDVAGWAAALDRLLGDEALRRRMGDAGRRFAETSYNADIFGAGLASRVAALT